MVGLFAAVGSQQKNFVLESRLDGNGFSADFMEKVCAVISVHEGGIGLAGSQENYSPKVSSSPEGYIKSNSRVCISVAIYRPADGNSQLRGSRFRGELAVGGRGGLRPCKAAGGWEGWGGERMCKVEAPCGYPASYPSLAGRHLEMKRRKEGEGRREQGWATPVRPDMGYHLTSSACCPAGLTQSKLAPGTRDGMPPPASPLRQGPRRHACLHEGALLPHAVRGGP